MPEKNFLKAIKSGGRREWEQVSPDPLYFECTFVYDLDLNGACEPLTSITLKPQTNPGHCKSH